MAEVPEGLTVDLAPSNATVAPHAKQPVVFGAGVETATRELPAAAMTRTRFFGAASKRFALTLWQEVAVTGP
jgi:hypothetical protein